MKKIFILALLPFAALAQTGFSIKGTVKGLKDSTLVFLQNGAGNTIAQDYAKKGAFTLTGKLTEPDLHQIAFIGRKDGIEVFLDNDNVTVTAEADKLANAVVIGGPLQTDYNAYVQSFTPLKNRLGKLAGEINPLPEGRKRDSLINQFTIARTKVVDLVNKYLKEKSGSPVSVFILFAVNPLFAEAGALEAKYDLLQPKVKTGPYAKMIEKIIADGKIGTVGSMAADFQLNDTANHPIKLSSFKGKYVLVDFWASWCRPCRMENPNVLQAYNTFKNKNFTVLGVSLDKEKANWVKAINDDKLAWTHVSDLQFWNNAAARLYQVQSIPTNLLIDPSGKIIDKNLRGEDLQAKLKALLN